MKTKSVVIETKVVILLAIILGMTFSGVAIPVAFSQDWIIGEVIEPEPVPVEPIRTDEIENEPEKSEPAIGIDESKAISELPSLNDFLIENKPLLPILEKKTSDIGNIKQEVVLADLARVRDRFYKKPVTQEEFLKYKEGIVRRNTEVPSVREYAEMIAQKIKEAKDYLARLFGGEVFDFESTKPLTPIILDTQKQKPQAQAHFTMEVKVQTKDADGNVAEHAVVEKQAVKGKGKFSKGKNITPWVARTDPSVKKPEEITEQKHRSDLIVSKKRPFQGGATIHRTVTTTTR